MAKYQGRTVKLNKISRGDVKKFKVFVKNKSTGKVKKVNFGSKEMSIRNISQLENVASWLVWVEFSKK